MFVYVLFEFLNKVAGFSVNVSWVIWDATPVNWPYDIHVIGL